MYKTKDGTSRSKAPVEESHVTNTSTLRSVFAKSAKLEAFDVLDTLGARHAHAALRLPSRRHRPPRSTRGGLPGLTPALHAVDTRRASRPQGRAHLGACGCAGTRTLAATRR